MQVETAINDRVIHGLRAQFSAERVSAILSQAETMALQGEYQNGNRVDLPKPELYELLEGGWIDRALEFLGFGRWAIGRPKVIRSPAEPMKEKSARHIVSVRPKLARSTTLLGVETTVQSVTNLLSAHLPKSIADFQQPREPLDNAIEYRAILIIGEQGSGKTTLAQTLAYSLAQQYGNENVLFALQVGGIRELLDYSTRTPASVWFLVGEDLTMSKIAKPTLAQFFQVRNLIMHRTGLKRGLVVTGFNNHTLFGIERNLRTAFQMLILKSVPSNPYDRGLLKRYFTPELLDWFEQHGAIDDALVWDRFHPHGVAAKVVRPPTNAIENVTVRLSFWARLFGARP